MLLVTLPVFTVICLHGPLPQLPKVDWLIPPFTARTWPNAQHCVVLKDKSFWHWKGGTATPMHLADGANGAAGLAWVAPTQWKRGPFSPPGSYL